MAAPPAARRRRPRRPAGGAVAATASERGASTRRRSGRRAQARRQRQAGPRPGLDLVAQQVQGARMGVGPAGGERDRRRAARRRAARSRAAPTSSRAWQTITARRRQSRCSAKAGSCSVASILRRPPRWPSTRSPMRRSWLCEKPGRVDVGEQVGAVAMVVVVRDHHAGLVQGRRPGELAARLVGSPSGRRCRAGASASVADAPRLREVDLEAPLQLAHRGVAQVLAAGATLGRLARREVEDHALAQRAARRLQLGDAEVRGQRVEDGAGRRR